MYKLKNGILFQDGKPVIALGQSYYPSFLEAKYPVPPEGDRIGIMQEDLRRMREAGFQFIRVAARGQVTLEQDGHISVNTPFIDQVVAEAHRNHMAVAVRLQGYVMNLRNHQDYMMINEKGEPMNLYWASFMRSTLFHEGIRQDNWEASQALARHFTPMPGVTAFQIYNEPHYPFNGIFDYHPKALEAYQNWRRKQGLDPQQAPHARPSRDENPEPWIQWRLFNMKAMSDFLADTAKAVKQAAPQKETCTCMTSSPVSNDVMGAGISYFDDAEDMDFVGITSYTHQEGMDYYTAAFQYDLAESAAALCGKHAWTIEIDARTRMPARKLHQETYSLLAAGHKGIVFYEWRGDYPAQGTPLPDNCGFIYHDGTKAEHCDRSLDMIRFVSQYGELLAATEKERDGVAILASDHANAFADAFRSKHMNENRMVHASIQCYRELRKAGVTVDFLQARHLKDNRLNTRLLFVPCDKSWLTSREQEQITAFTQAGGNVFFPVQRGTFGAVTPLGWWDWTCERKPDATLEFRANLEVEDVLELCGISPNLTVGNRHLMGGLLKGQGYTLVVLTNTDPARQEVRNATLTLRQAFSKARFVTPDEETELPPGKNLVLPTVREGGMLILTD